MEPTRSQNSTVSCRRSAEDLGAAVVPGAEAGGGTGPPGLPSLAPQSEQNFAPARLVAAARRAPRRHRRAALVAELAALADLRSAARAFHAAPEPLETVSLAQKPSALLPRGMSAFEGQGRRAEEPVRRVAER